MYILSLFYNTFYILLSILYLIHASDSQYLLSHFSFLVLTTDYIYLFAPTHQDEFPVCEILHGNKSDSALSCRSWMFQPFLHYLLAILTISSLLLAFSPFSHHFCLTIWSVYLLLLATSKILWSLCLFYCYNETFSTRVHLLGISVTSNHISVLTVWLSKAV